LELGFWRNVPTRIKRVLTIMMFFFLSVTVTVAGILTPLSSERASEMREEMEEIRENVSLQFIFGNNFMICLAIFVPFAGPIFGSYVLYNTGVVIAAESIAEGLPSLLVLVFLFAFPFTWLEFLAYSMAFSQSAWLIWRIIQHRGRDELVCTCILVSICAVMLLIAAITEIILISSLGG